MSTDTDGDTRLDDRSPASRQKSLSVSEWFARHGVLPSLTPMEYRTGDPVEQLQTVRDGIESLPSTAATFTAADFLDDGEQFTRTFAASTHLVTLFRLCRAFRCDDTSTGYRWSNPAYCHGSVHRDPWGSLPERIHFARQVAPLGRVRVVDIARHFGTTRETIRQDFQRAGFDWERRRRAGLATLARTIETIVDWKDHTYADVCSALGISPQCHRYHRQDKIDAAWSVPDDPTTEYGFTSR